MLGRRAVPLGARMWRRSLATSDVRVRYAPSPTGFIHLGGLRTALFNVLFAKRHGGVFFVRIEDTDQSRLVPGSDADIVRVLKWAGMTSDEPLTYQSQRLPIYREHALRLLDTGAAYRCFCSKERLEGLRSNGGMYPKFCLHTSEADTRAKLRDNLPHTIRLRVPQGERTVVTDLVRGRVVFDHFQVDDQVLMKSDGFPTYHLASVVDDHLMRVSHVIRGEEWLPSTVKHALLYRALEWDPPQFAHLPLLLSDKGGKLSKRHDDASVQSFIDAGFLPEALVNFVAFLGWTPASGREVLSMDEMAAEFSLERIHKGGAAVSRRKLEWLNAEHCGLQLRDPAARARLAQRFMPHVAHLTQDEVYAMRVLDTIHSRLAVFSEIASKCQYWFVEPDWNSDAAKAFRARVWPDDATASAWLTRVRDTLAALGPVWTPAAVAAALRDIQLPLGKLQALLRYALTGTEVGAALPDTICTLPRETVMRRLTAQ